MICGTKDIRTRIRAIRLKSKKEVKVTKIEAKLAVQRSAAERDDSFAEKITRLILGFFFSSMISILKNLTLSGDQ